MVDITLIYITAIICAGIGLGVGVLIMLALRGASSPGAERERRIEADGLQMWIDPASRSIRLVLDGRPLENSKTLTEGQRLALRKYAQTLAAWMEETPAAQSSTGPIRQRSDDYTPVIPPPVAVEQGRISPIDMIAKALEPNIPASMRVDKSIAQQIDGILQEKLAHSTLTTKAIRLLDKPGRGMVVLVGLDEYDGVDQVPDPEIRALIKQCVKEWEKLM